MGLQFWCYYTLQFINHLIKHPNFCSFINTLSIAWLCDQIHHPAITSYFKLNLQILTCNCSLIVRQLHWLRLESVLKRSLRSRITFIMKFLLDHFYLILRQFLYHLSTIFMDNSISSLECNIKVVEKREFCKWNNKAFILW